MQEEFDSLPKDLDIPLLECDQHTDFCWQTVHNLMEEIPNNSKKLPDLEDALVRYVMSVGPYIAAIVRATETEPPMVRVGALLDMYCALDSQRVDSIEELFPDCVGVITKTEHDAYYVEFEEILEESDNDAEVVGRLHSIFIEDIEADMETALHSRKVTKKLQGDKTKSVIIGELLDVAKFAAGTAIGFMIIKKLTRKKP